MITLGSRHVELWSNLGRSLAQVWYEIRTKLGSYQTSAKLRPKFGPEKMGGGGPERPKFGAKFGPKSAKVRGLEMESQRGKLGPKFGPKSAKLGGLESQKEPERAKFGAKLGQAWGKLGANLGPKFGGKGGGGGVRRTGLRQTWDRSSGEVRPKFGAIFGVLDEPSSDQTWTELGWDPSSDQTWVGTAGGGVPVFFGTGMSKLGSNLGQTWHHTWHQSSAQVCANLGRTWAKDRRHKIVDHEL